MLLRWPMIVVVSTARQVLRSSFRQIQFANHRTVCPIRPAIFIMGILNLKNSVACLLLLQLSISYAKPMAGRTVEVSGKGFTSKTTVNVHARLTRNATSLRQDVQPEIKADHASTSHGFPMQKNEDFIVGKQEESSAIQNPNEQPALTGDPDMPIPFWDSTKIENPKVQEESPISDDEVSPPTPPQQDNSSDDRIKEAERLQKVVSALHLNRVWSTSASPPIARRAFNGIPSEPFERQRALGFPQLITNTLDNFHHQVDWSRFSAFF
ncbi:uncharacterized protein LOC130693824 [Daphnia carinata]|uniref:uncharacterized protein LOC130693824 n=1 Tax=Daphnia carinata TaxID=120202 RepID=UPI00257F47B6|nr:uncharacterized protein LOC130693824 [Daphnia carinata]